MAPNETFVPNLASALSRNWWTLLLRGLVAIVFGILTFAQPQISLSALVVLFGLYALCDGIFSTVTALNSRDDRDDWGLLLIVGLIGVFVGLLTLLEPGITAVALLFYIAIWAIATGVLEIVAAIRLRKLIEGEWLLVLAGILSVVFGIFLMMRPAAGALAVAWTIATYAIIFGIMVGGLAFRVRGASKRFPTRTSTASGV
jgi:uncharacterized membrane protein HdeD (DUF308 family)